MNPRKYKGNLELIMESHEKCCESKGINENCGKVMSYYHFVYSQHILWVSSLLPIKKDIGKKDSVKQKIQKEEDSEGIENWSKVFLQEIKMVSVRSRKESVGEVEKWRKRTKVQNRLEKGEITQYIEKIHGYDKEVTKIMVKSQKDGHVKIDGVSHQVSMETISFIIEIPDEGIKF